jgi:hypothetical protein
LNAGGILEETDRSKNLSEGRKAYMIMDSYSAKNGSLYGGVVIGN